MDFQRTVGLFLCRPQIAWREKTATMRQWNADRWHSGFLALLRSVHGKMPSQLKT